jgi:penicillin amidase
MRVDRAHLRVSANLICSVWLIGRPHLSVGMPADSHRIIFFGIAILTLTLNAAAPLETRVVPGLREPVEIIKDRWGISHIYAKSENDLFFAQGYNIARDRLFQLELWRREATGTVAEILGRRELQRDIGNRLFKFRGDLHQELAWYHPHGSAIIEAFVKGINAYISETERTPGLLTVEFSALGIKPGKWTTDVIISRFNGLYTNVELEIDFALAISEIGVEKLAAIQHFQPADPVLQMDPAIDTSLLSEDILSLYYAFRRRLSVLPEDLARGARKDSNAASLLNPYAIAHEATPLDQLREDVGSNNWVVGSRLSSSGSPLLANDPHRIQQVPSLRYWVHLEAPGWNVIGGGEPSLPGVSIGHNSYGAWGLTFFGGDTEDLYVYDTNPNNLLQYKYKGGWETMAVVTESIPVKKQKPVLTKLKYTRHGPVIYEDEIHHKAYAVRAAWRDVGGAPYLASLRIDQAQSWQDFLDACAYSRSPSENMVWADAAGNIGYQAVGITPLRLKWSGLVPVPGDGRYEWDGYLAAKELPHVVNPEKGFWNTSNNYLIPSQWPHKAALHYMWVDPFRADAVEEFLSSGRRFAIRDMIDLQNSDLSMAARVLTRMLRDVPLAQHASEQARAQLLQWNCVLDKDSVAAGI